MILPRAQAWLPWAGLVALAGALYNAAFLGTAAGIDQLITADTLLPVQMAWDMHHHPWAWAGFQWPRVPSLLPDMAWFFAAEWLGLGWRRAMLGWSWLAIGLLSLGLGGLVAQLRAEPASRASARVAAALALAIAAVGLLCAAGAPAVLWFPLLYVALPVTHGGAFILSLFAARMALGRLEGRPGRWWPLLALCWAGAASDLLFVADFLAPLAIVCLLRLPPAARRDLPQLARALGLPLACALACALGWAVQLLLYRQPLPYLATAPLWWKALLLAMDLAAAPWAVLLFWLLGRMGRQALEALGGAPGQSCLLAFGALAAALSVPVLLLFYNDHTYSYRYALPLLWWPLLPLLADGPRAGGRWQGRLGWAALALGVGLPLAVPLRLLAWRSPLEACLSALARPAGLTAGLASYWYLRPTAASADWALQIDQIDDTGARGLWGNDTAAYGHDQNAPNHAPPYRFLIREPGLPAARMRTAFGPPQAIRPCPGADIWLYARPLIPAIFPR